MARCTHVAERRLQWSSMVIAGMIVAACGTGDSFSAATTSLQESVVTSAAPTTTTATTSEVSTTPGDDTWQIEIDLVGCDQVVTNDDVDPVDAAPFVPDDQELYLTGGRARVALVTKSCDDFVVDGQPLGPGHMDTLWLRVLGPPEGRSTPGIPDQEGRLPDAFVPLFIQTDNAAYSEAVAAYGVPLIVADEIDADPPDTEQRSGGATNSTFTPPMTYTWMMTRSGPSQGQGIASHLLHGVDSDGSPIWYDIDCPYDIDGRASITVEFDPGGPFEALVDTGWTSAAFEMRLDCRVAIGPR